MRIIGIRHRRKKTTEGEARPTEVFILEEKKERSYPLPDSTAELDWVMGRYPVKHKKPDPEEDLSDFLPHQIKWRKLKKNEKPKYFSKNLVRGSKKEHFLATKVPASYDGLQAGDTVAMVLGGSGDRLAFALSRRAEKIGATVLRIPSFRLKEEREGEKEKDAQNLAKLAKSKPGLFYQATPRDRNIIRVRECLQARNDAMKDRMACGQRLLQRTVGAIFCSESGGYPEGSIEEEFDKIKANDTIFTVLLEEEENREKELSKALENLDIYKIIFEPIKGVGPMIAARLISAIQDIRRFPGKAQLKAFCGVHVTKEGGFARRKRGEVANWHPDARQALYLLGDQFNRRPDSYWGERFRDYKKKLREKHPKVETKENGKKKYTDGHIHKMAMWRTLTKFVESLFAEWWRIEREHQVEQVS